MQTYHTVQAEIMIWFPHHDLPWSPPDGTWPCRPSNPQSDCAHVVVRNTACVRSTKEHIIRSLRRQLFFLFFFNHLVCMGSSNGILSAPEYGVRSAYPTTLIVPVSRVHLDSPCHSSAANTWVASIKSRAGSHCTLITPPFPY